MSLTEEEILEILKLVDESDFDELHLEMPGLKLHVGKKADHIPKGGEGLLPSEPRPLAAPTKEGPVQAVSTPMSMAATPTERAAPETGPLGPTVASLEEEGLVPIKSPVLGIFYSAPKPGAPPFVEVGQYVKEEDTVCLIEVMKLFNAVKAGLKGRIVKICAENTEMVEYNQTLFLVNPVELES